MIEMYTICQYSLHFNLSADIYATCSLLQRCVRACIRTACACVSQFQLDGNAAEVDLVLIQPFRLSGVNHVVLILTSSFQAQVSKENKRRFVSKQGQP